MNRSLDKERIPDERIDAMLAFSGLIHSQIEAADGDFWLRDDFSEFTALEPGRVEALQARAREINSLTPFRRRVWLTHWKEKLRRRGVTKRLDPNIHPEQISRVLDDEPLAIQKIIECNLPDELAEQVAIDLQDAPLIAFVRQNKGVRPEIDKRVIDVVRERFLSHFVAFEDLQEPRGYDNCTMKRLGNLIWRLGLFETARVCRAIDTIDQLAALLNKFEKETAAEISDCMNELPEVSVDRIRGAESNLEAVFLKTDDSVARIRLMGLRVFAEALGLRDSQSVRFNIQKLPLDIGAELEELIDYGESEQRRAIETEVERLAYELAGGDDND